MNIRTFASSLESSPNYMLQRSSKAVCIVTSHRAWFSFLSFV